MRHDSSRRPTPSDFAIVARQWLDLVGEPLRERSPNRLDAGVERSDNTFFQLAERAFANPDFTERLARLSQLWLRRCPCATTRAIAGYAAYLQQDFRRSVTHFLACLTDAADDLDTWIDLAFALNHVADPLGRHILFNHTEYIRRSADEPRGVYTLQRLERIRTAIDAEGAGYADQWPRFFEGVEPRL